MMLVEDDNQKLLKSRFRVNPDLPLEFTQLLDKLVDDPKKDATPVKR